MFCIISKFLGSRRNPICSTCKADQGRGGTFERLLWIRLTLPRDHINDHWKYLVKKNLRGKNVYPEMGTTMIWYPIMQYRNGHLTKGVCWLHLLWHDNIPQGPIFDNSGFCVDGADLISAVDLNGGCQVACLPATKWTSCIQRIRGMMPPWRFGQCDKSLALNIIYEWEACCENDVMSWSASSSQQVLIL